MLQRLGDESSSPSSDRDVDSSVSDRGQNVLPSHFRNLQSNWGRCLVAAVLLISAAVLGTVTFLLIRSDEVDDFNKEFEVASAEVVDGSRRNYETLLTGIHTFATPATLFPSVAGQLNETLLYLALRDYEAFGFGARQLTGALCFIYVPLLTAVGMQDKWEIYASANQGWIANGRSFYPDADEPIQESNPIIPYIHNLRDFQPDRSPGPKAPIWQSSPPPVDTDFINYEMYDNQAYTEIVNYTALTGTPVLSTPFSLREITNRFLSLDIPEWMDRCRYFYSLFTPK